MKLKLKSIVDLFSYNTYDLPRNHCNNIKYSLNLTKN